MFFIGHRHVSSRRRNCQRWGKEKLKNRVLIADSPLPHPPRSRPSHFSCTVIIQNFVVTPTPDFAEATDKEEISRSVNQICRIFELFPFQISNVPIFMCDSSTFPFFFSWAVRVVSRFRTPVYIREFKICSGGSCREIRKK